MQMCGSTDRQVKSMQRNIFIHLYVKQIAIFTNVWFSHCKWTCCPCCIYHVPPPYTNERFHDTHHIQFTMYISQLSHFSLSCTLKRASFRYSFLCVCMCFVNCLEHRHASEDKASQPVWTSLKVSTSFCHRPRKTKQKQTIGIWYTDSRYEGCICVCAWRLVRFKRPGAQPSWSRNGQPPSGWEDGPSPSSSSRLDPPLT